MLSRLYSWGRENAGLCDCTPVIINVQDMDYRLMMQESFFVGGANPIMGIFLAQRSKIYIPVKEKGASHSAFPLSTHVVLKTMYVNHKDYARRF